MKIYSNKFELRTPTDRRYYAAPNSIFAFGVKATLDGEDAEGTITVFQGSTELTPMEATVDGFKLYQRTSGSDTAVNEFDVVYTKDGKVQHFKLIETITNSTVFDIDQEGGAFELPIASSTILGGIKVGDNLTIDADGTLNADAQELTPATTTNLGGVIVGSGLSVDNTGKISVTGGSSSFESWLSGDGIVAGNNATGEGNNAVAIGKNAEANGADSVALGYDAYVDGNNAVQLGQGVNQTNNTLQFNEYTVIDGNGKVPAARMPVASTSAIGGIKVGQNLTIDADGTLNAQGGGSSGGPRMIIVNNLNYEYGPPLVELDDVQDCDVLIFPGGDPSPYGVSVAGVFIKSGPYAGPWSFSNGQGFSKYYTFAGGSQIIITIDANGQANFNLWYNAIGFSTGSAVHNYDYMSKQQ